MSPGEDEGKLLSALTQGDSHFGAFAEYFEGELPAYSVEQIFTIGEEELNAFGRLFAKKRKDDGALGANLDKMVKGANAYLQFQDLIDLTVRSPDDSTRAMEFMFNRGYFYYESLFYLRAAVLSILDANALAALSLLRPFCELAVFFLYYRYRTEEKGLQALYDWINRGKGKTSFKDALQSVVKNQEALCTTLHPSVAELGQLLTECYKNLSSYNHTPRLSESIGRKSGGLSPSHLEFVFYALFCLDTIFTALIPMMTIARPMVVFPTREHERLGFNGPVGAYADRCNYEILKGFLGEARVRDLQSALATNVEVEALQQFWNSQKSLEEKQIRESFHPDTEDDKRAAAEHPIPELLARKKAKMRALGWVMNYRTFTEAVEERKI